MSALELNFLGDVEVLRDGQRQPLPPSRKTRALLAYLALHPRTFRREHLCELLWEIPDDPRGSLRWSLSKLRRLVDDGQHTRILADRAQVGFEPRDVQIDVLTLRGWVRDRLESAPVDELEQASARYRGNFLEGLELPNFHEFHAWCISEREQAVRDRAALLQALVARYTQDPERALPHARALVAIDPYQESTRAALIRLLVATGRADEAEQQFRLGTRMLEEIRATPSGLLYQAWRGAPRSGPSPAADPFPRTGDDRPAPAIIPAPPPANDAMIGRDAEAQLLCDALTAVAREKRPQVLLLYGRPGIGKSRLLEVLDAPARTANARLLKASAIESESIRPFALWIDALRGSDGDAAATVFRGDEDDNRDRLFARLSEFVMRASAENPVVVVFDDFQWSDESSAAALHYVARTHADRPFLGVLAARDDEIRENTAVQQALRGLRHDGLLKEYTLSPLADDAVQHLIATHAPAADTALLGRACAGNPLIAIELARAVTAGESGSSLDELVLERLARCDAEVGDIIRWAAVLAPRVDAAMLTRVTGLDAARIDHALDVAERHAILQLSEQGFRFTHDLVARFVYNDISPVRRRVMHRRIAELLERDAALDLKLAADLAHHATQSGDAGLAARAMVSAGRLCVRFFANDDASTLARKGLQFAGQLSDADRVAVTLELRDIMLTAAPVDDWQAAADELVSLAEQALDHGALGHARLGYHMASYLRWAHGQWNHAREATLQAERAARHADDGSQIVGMAEAAKCLAMIERDLSEADAMLLEARALASRNRLSLPAIPAALGMLRYHENQLDDAEALFQEARTLYKSAGDRVNEFQANEYLVLIDIERGGYEAAAQRCVTLTALAEKLRDGSEEPFARALTGLCRYALDDDASALDDAFAALRIADAKHRLATVLSRTAWIDLERDRLDAAIARAGEALEYAILLERPSEQMLARLILADANTRKRDAAAARQHTAALVELEGVPVAQWARQRAAAIESRTPKPARRKR